MVGSSYHDPVLLHEALDFLLTDASQVYVDGTLGGGGHAEAICRRLAGAGRLVCFDMDEDAIRSARGRLESFRDRVTFVHSNFVGLSAELRALRIDAIAGLLLDLGVSSYQLDAPSRGFSFRTDEPLDMRMDRRGATTAGTLVNNSDEKTLGELIRTFGEERNYKRIARRIVAARPITTTGGLASAVEEASGQRFLAKTLARVFQAIRIEVNGELRNLERVLDEAMAVLMPGGRLVVVSYHSLEDRMVKDFFRREAAASVPSGHKYVPDTVRVPRLRILTKKPVGPSAGEVAGNPRAQSAKLRAAERLADGAG